MWYGEGLSENFFLYRAGGCEAKSFASVLLVQPVQPVLPPVALLLPLLLHVCSCVDDCVLLADVFLFNGAVSLKQHPRVHAIV